MELKIGDFVRDKWGHIGQIKSFETAYDFTEYTDGTLSDPEEEPIVFLTTYNHYGDEPDEMVIDNIVEKADNILDLLKPNDLILIDIDNGFAGGLVVPRIPETQAELDKIVNSFRTGYNTFAGVIGHESWMHDIEWVPEYHNYWGN